MIVNLTCDTCGEAFQRQAACIRPNSKTFCSKPCHVKAQYKHGKNASGYKVMRIDGKQVYEHRYVMEQHLGRKLKTSEHVHHKNEDKSDNRLENLEIKEESAHHMHHAPLAWDIDEAIKLRAQGYGWRRLAEHFGVARQNVREAFIRRGLQDHGQRARAHRWA